MGTRPLSTSESGPRILIIEDDAVLRAFLAEVLDEAQYALDCAGTCAEGRSLFKKGRYACALVDLRLPDGNGKTLLKEFADQDPEVVTVVLTGDATAEAVIDAMRAGAFDYLTKPVEVTTLEAAVRRALSHHAVRQDRTNLLNLLLEEREQLRARVEAATADIRQYANACEASNARLRSLLELTQLSSNYLSEQVLLQEAFEHLAEQVPLRALAFCDTTRQKMAAIVRPEGGVPSFTASDSAFESGSYDSVLAEFEPRQLLANWLERSTGLSTERLTPYAFTQQFVNRSACMVGFYVDDDGRDSALEEFLGMCAHFLAFEWEQGKLLLHVAHQASLGNIAVELARSFIQPLTAIRTAAEIVNEVVASSEGAEGMSIIQENADRLRRQMQEFQKLTLFREDSVETVRLDEYVDQALDMLAAAIQNRNVTVDRDFEEDCECVLLNGTALARTFLDLVLGAVRAVEIGGTVALTLKSSGSDHVAFEIRHHGTYAGPMGLTGAAVIPSGAETERGHPGLQLAERTVHSCGGTLTIEVDSDQLSAIRVVLPRNITSLAAKSGKTR